MTAREAIADRQARKQAAFEAAQTKAPRRAAAGAESKESTTTGLPEKRDDAPAG